MVLVLLDQFDMIDCSDMQLVGGGRMLPIVKKMLSGMFTFDPNGVIIKSNICTPPRQISLQRLFMLFPSLEAA
jgi:hypothetical protein